MLGARLLGDLGSAMGSFARGLSAFASGYEPIYGVEDGKLVLKGTKPLGKDLGKRAGETIQSFLTPLIGKDAVLYNLGKDQGWFFDGPVGNGIDLLGRLGNSLGSFANGIQQMANFYIPTYGVNDKGEMVITKVDKMSDSWASDLAINIDTMVMALIKPMAALGEQTGFFTDGPVGAGIRLLGDLGNSLSNFAQGVQGMANLQVPIYEVKDGKLVLKDTKPLDKGFADKVGQNVDMIINSLIKPISNLGANAGSWFSSEFEDGLELMGKIGEPLDKIASAAVKFAEIKVSEKQLKGSVEGTIKTFIEVLSNQNLKEYNTAKAKSVMSHFTWLANGVGKFKGGTSKNVSDMFVNIKNAVNDIDMAKLKKLNGLMYNMRKFAEEMNGSFGDLEKVLDKLVEVIQEMNGMDVKTATKPVETGTATVQQTKLDLGPLLEELEAIKDTLVGGIEVDVKGDMLSR
jgi:hypothetical protein